MKQLQIHAYDMHYTNITQRPHSDQEEKYGFAGANQGVKLNFTKET